MSQQDVRAGVLAVAGRRIDATGVSASERRFPLENVAGVRAEILRVFKDRPIELVVGSAACGADLLALQAALESGVPFIVVMPHDKDRFRRESVIDRPGSWGTMFDGIVADAERRRAVLIAAPHGEESPYAAATRTIVREAKTAAASRQSLLYALAIWDGRRRSTADYTGEFLDLATEAGAEVLPFIDTMERLHDVSKVGRK